MEADFQIQRYKHSVDFTMVLQPNRADDGIADTAQRQWSAEQLVQASYKDLGSPAEVEERFYRHLVANETCRRSLYKLLEENSTTTRDYSIEIDAFDLLESDPVLGFLLLRYPATLLPLLENSVVRGQADLLRQSSIQSEDTHDDTVQTVKGLKGDTVATTRVHARLVHLPPSCCKTSLARMQATDVGKIVQVSGTVVRTSPVQMYESARTHKCKGCNRNFVVHADLEQRQNSLQTPLQCPLMDVPTSGGEQQRCQSNKLQVVEGGSVHTDYQEIKIQEAASSLEIGHIPRSLLIKLQHDLVDRCQPGDQVVIVGSLLAQWHQQLLPNVECHVGVAMSAHSVRVIAEKNSFSAWQDSNGGKNSVGGQMDQFRKEFDAYWQDKTNQEFPIAARDFICRAVCPKLYGMKVIKLALLITLIGGVSSDAYEDTNAETTPRVDVSEHSNEGPEPFQMIATNAAPQGKDTNPAEYGDGPSSSNSTFRVTANRQGLVKTRRRDQSHLLLVGDPGTGKSQFLRFAADLCPRSVLTTGVGTTSAGLTCAAVREGNGNEFSLEAGALVLADTGVCCIDEFGCIQEKDRTTIHEAMEQQTLSVAKAGIVCKLNCRATIIAVMNPRNCLYDNHESLSVNTGLGTPLLSRFDLIFKLIDSSDADRDNNVTTYLLNRAIQGTGLDVAEPDSSLEAPWTMEKLRAYVSVVKEHFQPAMSDAAATLLESHYEKCRSARSNTIPVTVRFLESLIRLSQAHARLLYRTTVSLEDAVAAIDVMECSAFVYGGFDGTVARFVAQRYPAIPFVNIPLSTGSYTFLQLSQFPRRWGSRPR
jgi:DNA helicase MCM9